MSNRRLSVAGTALAGAAFGLAAPAHASNTMHPDREYLPQSYEYTAPDQPDTYRQPTEVQQQQDQTHHVEQAYPAKTYPLQTYPQQTYPSKTSVAPVDHAQPIAQVYYQQPQYQQVASSYDREAWLDECYGRVRSETRLRGSAGTGGLLGAVVGGVAGNRIAGRGNRLGGSLLGAGIGGLVGVLGGSAIDRNVNKRETRDYCEDYLTRYETGRGNGPYYAAPVQYVQVWVPVEQRAVVREYVEYVTVPETVYEEVEAVKVLPTKTQPVRYIKGH